MTGAERAEVMVRMTFGPNHRIKFSPDGALLAVCSAHHVEVIDARSGRVLRLIRGHAGMVADVAFSPDGTRIATASRDETARVWDAASGAAVATMTGLFEGAQDVAFSPDGTRLATASTLSGLVWDAVTGQLVASFVGHADLVTSVAFSPDGTLVVSAAVDETARVWEADTGGGRPGYAGSGQPRSAAASLKSAGSPRTPRSSQLEPFISLSTARSHRCTAEAMLGNPRGMGGRVY